MPGPPKVPKLSKGELMDYFLCVIGMVMIIEGLPWFASPSKMREVIVRMAYMEDRILRRIGFFLMIAGLGLVYLGRIGKL